MACGLRRFLELEESSPWLAALVEADCRQLMYLLEENPCRVVEGVKGGFTVLHAAAMRGCLKLEDQVFDLFPGDLFVNKKEGIKLSLQELCEAEGIYTDPHARNSRRNEEGIVEVGLTATEFAWWSWGGCCRARDLLDAGREFRFHRISNFSKYQEAICNPFIDIESLHAGNPSRRQSLLEVIAMHPIQFSPFGFEDALGGQEEYNFVADHKEFNFHCACMYLRESRFKEYVEAVIGGCVEKGPGVLKYLFQLCNAQGQTPLHVAVNASVCCELVRLIPGRASGDNVECLNMCDSRGWTTLHCCASLQDSSDDLNELLEDGRAEVNAKVIGVTPLQGDKDCTRATPLHLAVSHNSLKAVEMLLRDPRTDVNAHFHRQIYFDDSLYVSRFGHPLKEWTTLQLAAVAGLPEMVKVLLTRPKVKDVGKRQKHGEKKIHSSNLSTQMFQQYT